MGGKRDRGSHHFGGARRHDEGHSAAPQRPCGVCQIDGKTLKAPLVTDPFAEPNGRAFSPAEKSLYIIDTGPTHGGSTAVYAVKVGTQGARLP
jgi:gluconolactonase